MTSINFRLGLSIAKNVIALKLMSYIKPVTAKANATIFRKFSTKLCFVYLYTMSNSNNNSYTAIAT